MKLKVSHDSHAESEFYKLVKSKKEAFTDALTYVTKFVDVKDKKAFADDMLGTFNELWKSTHGKDFSKLISTGAQMQQAGINLEHLRNLATKFTDAAVEIDLNTLEPISVPDFGIYLTDKTQIQRFKALETVVFALDEMKNLGLNYYPLNIQAATSNTIVFDFHTNSLKPNLQLL